MLDLKYINDSAIYQVEFSKISDNVCQIKGDIPIKTNGFTLSRIGESDDWSYEAYNTVYREIEGGVQFSNNGSVYVEPKKKVTFIPGTGGKLTGSTEQEVYEYSELIVPSVEVEENYQFNGWSPEIPE